MPDDSPRRSLSWKLTILVVLLWVFVTVLSIAFVLLGAFELTPEQITLFIVSVTIGAVFFCFLVLLLVRHLTRPLVGFQKLHAAGKKVETSETEGVAKTARTLYWKLGLAGFGGPLFLMAGVSTCMVGLVDMFGKYVTYFMLLGLFSSLAMAAAFFLASLVWMSEIQGLVAQYRGGELGGRGLPLRLKLILLAVALALMPTVLVGGMSYRTADQLMSDEMGKALAAQLSQVCDDSVGLGDFSGSMWIDHLSDEAEKKLGVSTLHFRSKDGNFYRSEAAEPLPPGLFELIERRKAGKPVGHLVDPSTAKVYGYASCAGGEAVAIAPIDADALGSATGALLAQIALIAFISLFTAFSIGYVFALNIGSMVKRMAGVTEEVARGELTREVQVISDDEIGKLGASLSAMTGNLRRMVRDVTELSNQIASTCNQLLVKASAISTGAEVQSQSVHETSESVEELNTNIQSASDNLQSLAQSSQETAEAAQKVGESFNLMLAETGSLQDTVERTGLIVERMVDSVRDVAGSIKELSQGAERSSMSMSEMDRSISEVSSSAADTATIARKAIEVAQEGAVAVRRTIEGMDRIVSSTREASDVIVGLGNRIEDIGSILGVIDEIADQTNLLALNAAIIAAQAGDHGRSFAVVADEIRSLAERTAASTREITQMIGDIQETSEEAIKVMKGGGATVNEGVSLAKQAGDALNQILMSFQKAAENVESIAGYTEGQAQSSITVTREIGHVAEMASRIAQAASEQSRDGEQLKVSFQETLRTSQSLSRMVNQQAQENRQAIAAVSEMNEATTRANQALLDQSKVSDGILQAIEQVREIAKNHAKAASEMGEATQFLAEKSARLKEEIGEFHV